MSKNEPRPKIFKRRCTLCNIKIQSQSEQIVVKKYYEHLNECRDKEMEKFNKNYYGEDNV